MLNATKQRVYIADRQSLKILSTFGEAGELPGQFDLVHNMTMDSKGDLFITESHGRRVHKFFQS